MLRSGVTITDVARQVHCEHLATVRLKQAFQATGASTDRPRPGQAREATRGQDSQMLLTDLHSRLQTAAHTTAHAPGTLLQYMHLALCDNTYTWHSVTTHAPGTL